MFTILWVLRTTYTCETQIPMKTEHYHHTRKFLHVPFMSLSLKSNHYYSDFFPPWISFPCSRKSYKWNFCVFFHVRLLLLSIKFLWFVYDVVCINNLFLFIAGIVGIYHKFAYPFYFRHLDCFQLLAILNALAITIALYTSFLLSVIYPPIIWHHLVGREEKTFNQIDRVTQLLFLLTNFKRTVCLA